MKQASKKDVKVFFDKATSTFSYIVFDHETKDALVIDPVLNYDPASSSISYESVENILHFLKEHDLKLHYVLETHAHADHLTGAMEIKNRLPEVKIGIGKSITTVQKVFGAVYNLKALNTEGLQFDVLLDEGQLLKSGSLVVKTIFTPGHTPACLSYVIDNMVFVGDALFMPDTGTGRCDFPKGSAKELYNSIHRKLYNLPNDTQVYTGHDYQQGGREVQWLSSIGSQKTNNIYLKQNTTEEEFVELRTKRDAMLSVPKLLLQSLQVNIVAGKMPLEEDNGKIYFKIPVNIA